jgi:hypothetical protein
VTDSINLKEATLSTRSVRVRPAFTRSYLLVLIAIIATPAVCFWQLSRKGKIAPNGSLS